MTLDLPGGPRCGAVRAPVSKSAAHRYLICAALGAQSCEIRCGELSADLRATADCLAALGAAFIRSDGGVRIRPIRSVPGGELFLPCGESGSTLRFLLPVAGVLGVRAVFERRGRLGRRPLAPLTDELVRHGMTITEEGELLRCSGRLSGSDWTLPGDVSSQFISALLMTLPLLDGDSRLTVVGSIESAPYIALTEQILGEAAIRFSHAGAVYTVPGGQRPALPQLVDVEGDWSSAAVFLAMGALSPEGVAVRGLSLDSLQADRAVLALLRAFGAELLEEADRVLVRQSSRRAFCFDASQTPDLVPVAAALGALADGETRIINAARLRAKESDRLRTTCAMLASLGAEIRELPDGLVIWGKSSLSGGAAESFADHRVAMAAAVAACGCTGNVRLRGADCVGKSYPRFWDDFGSLGGLA
ncbi:MAG: 3-phosphoshikimate 1-carboxyvinyltransferase [Oscillospiraceae bacterium]|nr:3-phosphoshikimate 1-carboxyvinyltransferase [Oscillospiraceae bacterium]